MTIPELAIDDVIGEGWFGGVGARYVNRFLKEHQREIPEKTDEKVERARELLGIKKRGEPVPGMADGRIRWIGENGYRPPAKRAGAPA